MIEPFQVSRTSQFRRQLLRWYKTNRRQLPWRETTDPYRIWVSEIMLQQTQVATVLDYYHRFVARFPNLKTLAEADEQDVLVYWAGLGYYRRARQLHAAAKQIVEQYAGAFPKTLEDVRSLPGICRYTAGAIASFAYGIRAPILEANTLRLYSRLIGLSEDPKSTQAQARLWEFAEGILPKQGNNVGLVNQATMELGSLVCLPKEPQCQCCPVASHCSAKRAGLQAQIPLPAKKTKFLPLTHVLVIIRRENQVLLRQNSATAWWAGLWDFPRVDITELGLAIDSQRLESEDQHAVVEQAMYERLKLACSVHSYLQTIKHGVTRYRITLHCFQAKIAKRSKLPSDETWRWTNLQTDVDTPLTSTAKKLKTSLLGQVGLTMASAKIGQ